jgi:hypothetical protein
MKTYTVEWDKPSADFLRDRRVSRAVTAAFKKAGGDALRFMRAEAKRQVRARVRIRAGYLANKSFPLRYARGKTLDELSWEMRVSGREVPLGEYPARQTKRGVKVEVERGKRVLLKSAFLAKGRAPRKGVFLRPTKKNYPMGHRLGLRVSDSMTDGRIPQAVLGRTGVKMFYAFQRLFPLELGKR